MSKPRSLGNVAHQNVAAADSHLTVADRLLEPQSRGETVRFELVAAKARLNISEAKRRLGTVLALGTEPPPEEKP